MSESIDMNIELQLRAKADLKLEIPEIRAKLMVILPKLGRQPELGLGEDLYNDIKDEATRMAWEKNDNASQLKIWIDGLVEYTSRKNVGTGDQRVHIIRELDLSREIIEEVSCSADLGWDISVKLITNGSESGRIGRENPESKLSPLDPTPRPSEADRQIVQTPAKWTESWSRRIGGMLLKDDVNSESQVPLPTID